MSKVSIIVPVYNTSAYLEECINSLVNQTLKEIQIIFVDDGSTDHSLSILRKYEKEYPEKIEVYSKENGGQGAARNYALQYVKGKYLSFVDSDDWIDLHTYEKAYTVAEKNQSDIVFWDLEWVFDDGKKFIHNTFSNVEKKLDGIGYMLSDPSPCNKMIRSSIFLENQIRFPENCWYEDMAVIPSLVKYIHKMEYLKEPFYKYRQRSNSTMQQEKYNPKLKDIIIAINYLFEQMKGSSFSDEMEYLYIFQVLYFASFRFMKFKKYNDIFECYQSLIEKYPNWKNNKYYKEKPFLFRFYCELLEKKHYVLASLLISLRKLIQK